MKPRAKWALGGLLVVSMGAVLYFGAQRILEQQRTAAEVTRLRDQLYRARVSAERCRRSLASNEGALQDFRGRIDSLRARIDSFEALDPRGVPQEDYDAYMESFNAFNDSVGTWEANAEGLRAQDASCREAIVTHNAIGDSLRDLLVEIGGEPGG